MKSLFCFAYWPKRVLDLAPILISIYRIGFEERQLQGSFLGLYRSSDHRWSQKWKLMPLRAMFMVSSAVLVIVLMFAGKGLFGERPQAAYQQSTIVRHCRRALDTASPRTPYHISAGK